MDLKISVLAGANKGLIKQFTNFPISIGRLPDSDIQLIDLFVSRRHCAIYEDNSVLTISDLKSTNKTILNKKVIDSPTLIKNGDKLIIGENLLLINIANQVI